MRSRSLFTLVLILLTAATAFAGPVTGRVVDPDGRAVSGAAVLLVTGAAVRDSTVTNARGEFTLRAPDAGRFEVRVALDGFRAAAQTVDAKGLHEGPYEAGGVHLVCTGTGTVRAGDHAVEVDGCGCYTLVDHGRHTTALLHAEVEGDVEVLATCFTPALP